MKSLTTRLALLIAAALLIPACGKGKDSSSGGGGAAPPPGGNPPPSGLAAPTNVLAVPGDRMITMTWDPVAGATGYTIRSATDQGGPYGLVEHNFPGTTFVDDTLDNGTTYYYVLTTVNSAGEGPPSPEVSATPVGGAPPPPTSTWTKDVRNPVFTASSDPAAWDRGGVFDPNVMRVGADWVMYYTGTAGVGGALAIGRSTSADGATWIRTGAAPVLAPGAAGEWDSSSVMRPHVLFDGTNFRMWYTGTNGGAPQIGYATSPDGIVWSKAIAPVLMSGPAGSWDAMGVSSPSVLLDGIGYRLWYTGSDGAAVQQVGYATSTDGLTWSKYPVPVLVPTAGTFDARATGDLHVMQSGAGLQGWYTGSSGVGGAVTNRIGYATSADGITWSKQPPAGPQPVLSVGAAGSWDGGDVASPSVAPAGAAFNMWYSGRNAATGVTAIGMATGGP